MRGLPALALLFVAAVASADVHRLANGIDVVLAPEPGCGQIALVVWVPVGSRDEAPGATGRAHLFEHLLFTGTARVPEGELDRLIEEAGGWTNAFTTPDATVYTTLATAGALERVLWLEADRFGGLALRAPALATQKDVVANERRQRYENRPYGAAEALIAGALWPEQHGYRGLTIGVPDDVTGVDLAGAAEFYRAHYTPDGLVVVLAGDFEPAAARQLVERTLGQLPGRQRPERAPAPVPAPLRAPVVVQHDDEVQATRVYFTWRTPAWYGESDAPLAAAASLLGGGRASRLWRRLVLEEQSAESVAAGYVEAEWAGTFQIVVTLRPGKDVAQVVAAVEAEIRTLASLGPSPGELARARDQLEAGLLEGFQELPARALQLARWHIATGDADRLERELARWRGVSRAEVRRAILRHLDRRAVVRLVIGPAEEP